MQLHSQSFDEGALEAAAATFAVASSTQPLPSWGRHHSVCTDDYISLPAVDTFQNPEICVTNSSGELVSIPARVGSGGESVSTLGIPPPASLGGPPGAGGAAVLAAQTGGYAYERMDESY